MAVPAWFVTAQNTPAAVVASVPAAPVGTLDGTNTVFTLSSANLLMLVLNGVVQQPLVDFTLTGSTITYSVAPRVDDWHIAFYSH